MNDSHKERPSLIWPLILIGAGLIFLLANLNLLPGGTWDLLAKLWPLLLVVLGLDSLFRHRGVAGPVLLLGLGGILLGNNLGYLAVDWTLLLSMWPALLIAFGFDLIFGRRSCLGATIGVVLALGLLAGVLWLASAQNRAAPAPQTVSQPLQGAKQARITLEPAAGQLKVQALDDNKTLLKGTVAVPSGMTLDEQYQIQDGQAVYVLRLLGASAPVPSIAQRWGWDIGLAPAVPLSLQVTMGAGQNLLNLSKLDLSNLQMSTGMGQSILTLPPKGNFNGQVSGGMGQVVVEVPRGGAVRLEMDTAMVYVTVPAGYTRQGKTYLSPEYAKTSKGMSLKIGLGMGQVVVKEK